MKNLFLLIGIILILINCNSPESNKLKFNINQSTFADKLVKKNVIDGFNEPEFSPITGTIRIGDKDIPGVLGGFTCNDSRCVEEEHLTPPLNIRINPPSGCVDTRCIDMPIEVSLPFINIPLDYQCQYAICTEVYYENLLLKPYRKTKMMIKPSSCDDSKCVNPNTKHGPNGPQETDEEKKRRMEEIEDEKNKKMTEAAKKEAEEKKEAKVKAEEKKKEAEKKEKDAEHKRKQAEHRSSTAKEKYDRERQNDPKSEATKVYQIQYNEAQLAEEKTRLYELQTNQNFQERQHERMITEREFNQREIEYHEAQERYEWNVEADRTIRGWRNTRALCNAVGCDFIPIGLKQPMSPN